MRDEGQDGGRQYKPYGVTADQNLLLGLGGTPKA